MHILFLLLLVFPFFAQQEDNLYGSYRMDDKGMILELTPPNNYTLFMVERDKTGMVTSKELSRGTFAANNNQLELTGQMTNKSMILTAGEDDKLYAKEMVGLKQGDALLRWSGYYESGKVKFEGSWRKGKKHGEWVYYNEDGDVQKKEMYKRGKLKS